MTIRTRYRDIPYEEVRSLHNCPGFSWIGGIEEWEGRRGKFILIQTPSPGFAPCGSQMFDVLEVDGQPNLGLWACEHIAEIGD